MKLLTKKEEKKNGNKNGKILETIKFIKEFKEQFKGLTFDEDGMLVYDTEKGAN